MAFIEDQTYFDSILMTVTEEGGALSMGELIRILKNAYGDVLKGDISENTRKTVDQMVSEGTLNLSKKNIVALRMFR